MKTPEGSLSNAPKQTPEKMEGRKNEVIEILYSAIPSTRIAIETIANDVPTKEGADTLVPIDALAILSDLEEVIEAEHNGRPSRVSLDDLKNKKDDFMRSESFGANELNSGQIHPSHSRENLERHMSVATMINGLVSLALDNKGGYRVADHLRNVVREMAKTVKRNNSSTSSREIENEINRVATGSRESRGYLDDNK